MVEGCRKSSIAGGVRPAACLLLACAISAAGCLPLVSYQTAHVLAKGETSVAAVALEPHIAEVRSFSPEPAWMPAWEALLWNLPPELAVRHGAADGLEIGGRIALQGIVGAAAETDAKVRLIHAGPLWLALDTALQGYLLPVAGGAMATGIATLDLGPRVSLNASAQAGAGYGENPDEAFCFDGCSSPRSGPIYTYGGSAGIELRFDRFSLMPEVTFQRVAFPRAAAYDTTRYDVLSIGLVFSSTGRSTASP